MRKANVLSIATLGIFFAFMLGAATAHAQATRTWVSGVGDDANPCSRTAPCKTFAGAISKTVAGGIINCLDPGGFGALTIFNKSITIDCSHTFAGSLASGTNGINVNVGAADIVTLRGLSIEGNPGTGLIGVNFTNGGTLHIEKCTIAAFRGGSALGINFAPAIGGELHVTDTTINDNGSAASGGGIQVRPTGSGGATVMLSRVRVNNNLVGVIADSRGGTGTVRVELLDSVVSGNVNTGVVSETTASGPTSSIFMIRSSSVNNANVGVFVDGANANVILGDSTISFNNFGVATVNGGRAYTYGNNYINSNTTGDGTPLPNGLQRF
jgi:hypothetical protein